MAGKGGGAWKVAYADFVTAMMAFFMVMWLVGQDQEKRKAVAEYFQDPWAKSRVNFNRSRNQTSRDEHLAGLTPPEKQYSGSNPKLIPHDEPEAPDAKQPKLVTVRAPERSTIGTVVLFESDSTEVSQEAKDKLALVVPRMKGLANIIDIRGHVSQQMSNAGNAVAAWDLSYKRSRAVMQTLIDLGLEENRMRISAAGSNEPLSDSGFAQPTEPNARVEIFLLSETIHKFKPNNHQAPRDESKPLPGEAKQVGDAHAH